MVPAHIEQDCNAYDAMKAGAGIISDSFDLQPLLRFLSGNMPRTDHFFIGFAVVNVGSSWNWRNWQPHNQK